MTMTGIEWTKLTDESCYPEEDGDYIIILDWGYRGLVHYSTKHRAFNTYSTQTEREAKASASTGVLWWGKVAYPEEVESLI